MVLQIKNKEMWHRAKGSVVFSNNPQRRVLECIANSVGPCIARLQQLEAGSKPDTWVKVGEPILIGVFEGQETIRFPAEGHVALVFEGSDEVWVYRDMRPLAVQGDPENEPFTRFEKAALYIDELGAVLHRQAVLNRLQRKGETTAANARTVQLEQQIEQLAETVKALTAKPVEPAKEPDKEPAKEPVKADGK